MAGPLFTVPATDGQRRRITELAEWPGLPQPDSREYAAKRLAGPLTKDEAYELIRNYGTRIANLRANGGEDANWIHR